jgi:hypothetical protein
VDYLRKRVPVCPFCRQQEYQVSPLVAETVSHQPSSLSLDGTWDVDITEKSKIGCSQYKVTLTINGDSAKYEDPENHFDGSAWEELTFGHTKSGKSFTASQHLRRAPEWLGRGTSVDGHTGLLGRIEGTDSANFKTTVTYLSAEDDELEVSQTAKMTRRRNGRCITI